MIFLAIFSPSCLYVEKMTPCKYASKSAMSFWWFQIKLGSSLDFKQAKIYFEFLVKHIQFEYLPSGNDFVKSC